MLLAHPVVDAPKRSLQVGEDLVDHGQKHYILVGSHRRGYVPVGPWLVPADLHQRRPENFQEIYKIVGPRRNALRKRDLDT